MAALREQLPSEALHTPSPGVASTESTVLLTLMLSAWVENGKRASATKSILLSMTSPGESECGKIRGELSILFGNGKGNEWEGKTL